MPLRRCRRRRRLSRLSASAATSTPSPSLRELSSVWVDAISCGGRALSLVLVLLLAKACRAVLPHRLLRLRDDVLGRDPCRRGADAESAESPWPMEAARGRELCRRGGAPKLMKSASDTWTAKSLRLTSEVNPNEVTLQDDRDKLRIVIKSGECHYLWLLRATNSRAPQGDAI